MLGLNLFVETVSSSPSTIVINLRSSGLCLTLRGPEYGGLENTFIFLCITILIEVGFNVRIALQCFSMKISKHLVATINFI